jgi:hypothetical protein
MAIEDKVIAVEKISCRGLTDNGGPAFDNENSQQVIVKVYEDGTSIPLCPCFVGEEGVRGKCNYKFLNDDIDESAKRIFYEFKRCPYNTFN